MADETPTDPTTLNEIVDELVDMDFIDDDMEELLQMITRIAGIVLKAAKEFRQKRLDAGKDPLVEVIFEQMKKRRDERVAARRERWRQRS